MRYQYERHGPFTFPAPSRSTQSPTTIDLTNWSNIDDGIATESQTLINTGNRLLLEREQKEILRNMYAQLSLWHLTPTANTFFSWQIRADHLLSYLAKQNPMRRGQAFQIVVPNGNIAVYNDRWLWITDSQNGMFPMWSGTSLSMYQYNEASRKSTVEMEMRQAAAMFTDTGVLPP